MLTEIKASNFGEYASKEECALFVFGTSWCPDCVRINPFLDTLAEEFDKKISIYKIIIDSVDEIDKTLNIRKIPTLIFYKDGKEVGERLIEPQTINPIRDSLQALL